MSSKTLVLALFVFLSGIIDLSSSRPSFYSCHSRKNGQGTTREIKDIFLGRCQEYQAFVNPQGCLKNCTNLWNLFTSAFAYAPPCEVSISDYEPFIEAAIEPVPKDKLLLWAGTLRVAHEYAEERRRMTTLEDTMIGYLVNQLAWCGSLADPGIDFKACPARGTCKGTEYDIAFWAAASASFARQARGVVTVMLNGSNTNPEWPTFRESSFLSRYELPNLNPKAVRLIKAIVIHDIDGPIRERCGTNSLLELERRVTEKHIEFECYDDPKSIHHLLCIDDPTARECKFLEKTKPFFDIDMYFQ